MQYAVKWCTKRGRLQVKERIKGHTDEGAPLEEAGNVPGVLAVEDDAEQCGAMPDTSAGSRGGDAARKARKVSPIEIVNKVQPPFTKGLIFRQLQKA